MRVSLILDTSTYMPEYQVPKGLSKYLNDDKELTKICQDISLIMKMNAENHEQSLVTFSWGQHGILWTHYFLKHQLSDV